MRDEALTRLREDPPLIRDLRCIFSDAHLDEATLESLVGGPLSRTAVGAAPLVAALHAPRLATSSNANACLAALFVLQAPVAEQHLRTVLGPPAVEVLCAAEVCIRQHGQLRAAVSLSLYCEDYFLADPLFTWSAEGISWRSLSGAVMPLHVSSLYLLEEDGLDEAGTLLDAGTGSACLAIGLGARKTRIVATDINPRALKFAAVNALMNDRTNFVVVEDDIFNSRVAPGKFDVVVFNTPSRPRYRDTAVVSLWDDPVRRTADLLQIMNADLLSHAGQCALFVLLCLRPGESLASATAIMQSAVPTLHLVVKAIDDERMRLTPDDLARGRLPPGSLLIDQPCDLAHLQKHLDTRGYDTIVPAIVRATRHSE